MHWQRSIAAVCAGVLLAACGHAPTAPTASLPVSVSVTAPTDHRAFLAAITAEIAAHHYDRALATLHAVDPRHEAQRAVDEGDRRYLSIAEDAIIVPGVHFSAANDPREAQAWNMPGTEDAIEDEPWQNESTAFATSYNQELESLLKHPVDAEKTPLTPSAPPRPAP